VSKEIPVVSSSPDAASDGVESQLLDLGTVSFGSLRSIETPAFRRAIQHVEDQAGTPSKTETSCSSVAGLD
jgi:hypothetical protein